MPTYAWIDPANPEPHRVRGWYDTDFADYALPHAAELVELTPEQWTVRFERSWWHDGALVPEPADTQPDGPMPPRRVAKLLIVRRMRAHGTLAAALALLDADPLDKAEWDAAGETVPADDARVRLLILASGDDPDVVMRPGEDVEPPPPAEAPSEETPEPAPDASEEEPDPAEGPPVGEPKAGAAPAET